jgi:hypothetical protein
MNWARNFIYFKVRNKIKCDIALKIMMWYLESYLEVLVSMVW